MPFLKEELERIEELYKIIESHKEHEYSAPTYKDSPCLKEMGEIVLRHQDRDLETLQDILTALCYLTRAYDQMHRAGISVKYYTPLLQAHTELMKLREYDFDEKRFFENCFYMAVEARNCYEPDDCADLVEIVSGSLPDEKIKILLGSAQYYSSIQLKRDPVEKTEEYLAVIDRVEERIEKAQAADSRLEYWDLKAQYLLEYGIVWRSPLQLNPKI